MANSDIVSGFRPVGHLLGAAWSGKANVYYIPVTNATALFKGDAVKLTGTADVTGKYPGVVQVGGGDETVLGVIIGFGEDPHTMIKADSPYRVHCPISTEMYCLVVDDPFVIFEIQEDSVGGAMAVTAVGNSVDIVVGDGSTTTGKSGMELDSNTATDGAATCKLLRRVDREDNALGDHCKWEVTIIEHQMLTSTGV